MAANSVRLALLDDIFEETDDIGNSFDIVMVAACLAVRYERTRVENYIYDVVPLYSPDTFRTFFRLPRTTFEELLRICHGVPELERTEPAAGRPQIPIEKDLMMHLWYMGSQECVRSIADRFDISESTFVAHNRRMLNVFSNHFMEKFITWPLPTEYATISDAFERRKGFPGIIGALDGSHIRIKAPIHHETDYINRKKYHSIILQAVCREDLRFTDICVGWPGRVHDSRVLRNSPIWQKGPNICGQHLVLADGAYPCRRWLLTPYRDNGNLTRQQRKYNNCLSGSRVVIENSFGILKGRFRRLQYIDMADVSFINKAIVAACILHNMCIIGGDDLSDIFGDHQTPDGNANVNVLQNDAEGPLRRLQITRQLNM